MDRPVRDELPGAVLFACNLNAVRSPMAAALMRHLLGHKVFVASVGVRAGEIDPFCVAVLDEIGIDLSNHDPVSFDDLHDTLFDVVISLTPQAQHKAVEMTRTMAVDVEYWPTHDPTLASGSREQILEAYRTVRDDLLKRIKQRFDVRPGPQI